MNIKNILRKKKNFFIILMLLVSSSILSSCTTQERNGVNLLPQNRPQSWEGGRFGTPLY